MSAEKGSVSTVSLDPSAQRRRTWAAGAGILVTIGLVVVGMALAGRGTPSPQPVATQAPVQTAPTSAAPSAPAPTSAAASTTPARTTAVLDVDGDGRPDTASTTFLGKQSAQLVVHLATGKTLTSKAFPLYKQDAAGKLFAADVNGDHRSELFVSDPGADGTGYELFSYVRTSLVEVPAPKGQIAPYLYIGGGMYYDSTFSCADGRLLEVKEQPDVKNTANLPPDPPFLVTTTTYALAGGVLKATDETTVGVPGRAQAAAKLAAMGNGCGTRP
jgi:hypothetical protein